MDLFKAFKVCHSFAGGRHYWVLQQSTHPGHSISKINAAVWYISVQDRVELRSARLSLSLVHLLSFIMAGCSGVAKMPAAGRHCTSVMPSTSFVGGRAALRRQIQPIVAEGATLEFPSAPRLCRR